MTRTRTLAAAGLTAALLTAGGTALAAQQPATPAAVHHQAATATDPAAPAPVVKTAPAATTPAPRPAAPPAAPVVHLAPRRATPARPAAHQQAATPTVAPRPAPTTTQAAAPAGPIHTCPDHPQMSDDPWITANCTTPQGPAEQIGRQIDCPDGTVGLQNAAGVVDCTPGHPTATPTATR